VVAVAVEVVLVEQVTRHLLRLLKAATVALEQPITLPIQTAVVVVALLLPVLPQQVRGQAMVEQEQHPLFPVRPSHTLVAVVAQ
jgi:hypothetical protein